MTARAAIPTPSAGAKYSTFQLGVYNALTDTFTSVFDLNDRTNTKMHRLGLDIAQPKKNYSDSSNLRTPGTTITRIQYDNQHVTAEFWIQDTTPQAVVNRAHTLIQVIEAPPYTIRMALPGATQYSYLDVLAAESTIPSDTQQLNANVQTHIRVNFECAPGFRGDRLWLQNYAMNPGFEAPSGPAVPVFTDTFANTNAYSSQAGSAPTAGSVTGSFSDLVMSFNPVRYYRHQEASGTVAYDVSGSGQNGAYVNAPTLGVASGVSGESNDKAVTYASASSQRTSVPTTSLPSGNSAITFMQAINIAGAPGGTVGMMCYGTSGSHNVFQLIMNTSRQVLIDLGGAGNVTSTAVSTSAWHLAIATWDGTTLKLYIDGASVGTPITPGAQTIPSSATNLNIAANPSAAAFFSGTSDEEAVFATALSAANVTTLWNAFSAATGLPTITNTLSVTSGARIQFGSPNWGAINTWQARFRFLTSGDYRFYLHYTDANNWLRARVQGTTLTLEHNVASVTSTQASVAIVLANNVWYWVRVTQYPVGAAAINLNPPYLQAALLNDGTTAGAVGAQVASTGGVVAASTSVAVSGRPQIEASGATLVLGGGVSSVAYSGVHTMGLFGPGGWTTYGNFGTGNASAAWEQSTSNTYPSGPWTSYGALRFDFAPAGTSSFTAYSYSGGSPTGALGAIPVSAITDVYAASVRVKSSGLGGATPANGSVSLALAEFDASGSLLRQGNVAASTGTTTNAGWTTLSGTYTPGASCAYLGILLSAADTSAGGASANAIVWWDNLQLWNQTQTGQTVGNMPYCELRFPQAPAQINLSGLLGDMPAPALLGVGTFISSSNTIAPGEYISFLLGRRPAAGATTRLIGAAFSADLNMALDTTAYGGCYATATIAAHLAGYVPMNTGDGLGVYHLFARLYTGESTLSRMSAQPSVRQMQNDGSGLSVSEALFSVNAAPFTAANTWTTVDAGQVWLPAAASGVVANPATYPMQPWLRQTDSTAPALVRDNWHALMPIADELIAGQIVDPATSSNTLSNQFAWVFLDGLGIQQGAGWGVTLDVSTNTAAAAPESGQFAYAQTSGTFVGVSLGGDPYLTLDPTITVSGAAVNQLCAILTDNTAAVLPILTELQYSPLFLYPR